MDGFAKRVCNDTCLRYLRTYQLSFGQDFSQEEIGKTGFSHSNSPTEPEPKQVMSYLFIAEEGTFLFHSSKIEDTYLQ